MSMYVDGALVGTDGNISDVGVLTTDTLETLVGSDEIDNYDDMHMQLDDVGIWRRSLSQYEINTLYYQGEAGGQVLVLADVSILRFTGFGLPEENASNFLFLRNLAQYALEN